MRRRCLRFAPLPAPRRERACAGWRIAARYCAQAGACRAGVGRRANGAARASRCTGAERSRPAACRAGCSSAGDRGGEARISAADARLQLVSAYVAAHQQQLAAEQQPVSSLLAVSPPWRERPPLLVLADRGGTDELVEVRLLLDSTLPVIRSTNGAPLGRSSQRGSGCSRRRLRRANELVEQPRRACSRGGSALRRSSRRRSCGRWHRADRRSASSDVAHGRARGRRASARRADEQPVDPARRRPAGGRGSCAAEPVRAEGGTPRPPFAYRASGRRARHRRSRRGERERRPLARPHADDLSRAPR